MHVFVSVQILRESFDRFQGLFGELSAPQDNDGEKSEKAEKAAGNFLKLGQDGAATSLAGLKASDSLRPLPWLHSTFFIEKS